MELNVLIVDECENIRDMMESFFETSDFDVSEVYLVSNNMEALNIIENNKVDIVFYDFDARELDGLGFLYHLYYHGKNENYLVIPTVSIWIESRIQLLRNIGLEIFLKKPFGFHNVKNIMSEHVMRKV